MPFYGLFIPSKNGASGGLGTSSSLGGCSISSVTATSTTAGVGVGAAQGHTANGNMIAGDNSSEPAYVFQTKGEALGVLKQHKDARLREFAIEEDAIKYSQTGYEVVQNKYNDSKNSTANLEKAIFRAPTKQELTEFRKLIESGDIQRVKQIIWENPRYLVSSGDTPTSLKESCRYNALHICAISKKPQIAELLLQTVSDPKFVDLLVGKKNDLPMCKKLCASLLDYYLNIPEKGRSETPLHLSVKYGAIEMIEVLTSYPECKMLPNKEGAMPKDIICARVSNAAPELCKKIESFLQERFYVPVFRSADGAIPPTIGQPFSSNNPPNLNADHLSPEIKIQALAGPMNKEHASQFCRRWKTPPRAGSNITSPIIRNSFITPNKSRINNSTPIKTPNSDGGKPSAVRLIGRSLFTSTPQDTSVPNSSVDKQNGNHKNVDVNQAIFKEVSQKINLPQNTKNDANGLNNNNNDNQIDDCNQENIPINNSIIDIVVTPPISVLRARLALETPLLRVKKDTFFSYREQTYSSPVVFDAWNASNNSSINGTNSTLFDSPGFKERHIKIIDPEKGLEVIGRELAKEQNVEWREYWDFINAFTDITSSDGLLLLENYLLHRKKEADALKKSSHIAVLDDVCTALEKLNVSKESEGPNSTEERNRCLGSGSYASVAASPPPTHQQSTTPHTCVEKSLQVFAKRMTKTVIHNIDNVISINDTLLSELKRLKSLICSFKEDARFANVNFSKVHSRIGNLISIYLESSQEVNIITKLHIQLIIQNLLSISGERREHIECVCSRILHMMETSNEQILPENLKTDEMCSKIWSEENSCDCQWETNLSRKTSRRLRMETRYKSSQQTKIIEKQNKNKNANEECRSVGSLENDSSDDMEEEDIFLSDFGGSSTDDDNEMFWTPPESPSRISLVDSINDDSCKMFIYGNEPTKRDLDVLNAVFHLDIDKAKYPHVYAWKETLLSYSTAEMDYFPSPSIVKKPNSRILNDSIVNTMTPRTPQATKQPNLNSPLANQAQTAILAGSQPGQEQLPITKRLFTPPLRAKINTGLQFVTPLNKPRGLFAAYREHLESSGGSEGSLFNISATE